MAWGLGEKILGPGGKQIFDQAFNASSKIVGKGFNKVGSFTSDMSRRFYSSMAEQQDEIANPHFYNNRVTDDRGNLVPGRSANRTAVDDFGNVVSSGRENSWLKQKYNLGKHEFKTGVKSFGIGTLLSGGMYGLSAWATDDDGMAASDRMHNVAKHAVAATADVASDAVLTGVGAALATFGGPLGMAAGMGIQAFNMFAGFAGIDAGSIAMNVMNYADEQYEIAKNGGIKSFNMTQNTAMSMQRQLSNIAMSGSNLGEIMHNAVDNRELYDCLQNNEFKKSENLCGTNFKKSRRKMAPTFEI